MKWVLKIGSQVKQREHQIILIGDLRLLHICLKVSLSTKILEETLESLDQVTYNG